MSEDQVNSRLDPIPGNEHPKPLVVLSFNVMYLLLQLARIQRNPVQDISLQSVVASYPMFLDWTDNPFVLIFYQGWGAIYIEMEGVVYKQPYHQKSCSYTSILKLYLCSRNHTLNNTKPLEAIWRLINWLQLERVSLTSSKWVNLIFFFPISVRLTLSNALPPSVSANLRQRKGGGGRLRMRITKESKILKHNQLPIHVQTASYL